MKGSVLMIVRIRFGSGRLVTHRQGKNGPAARLLASLLNLVSISFAVFGLWRLGQDLGMLGDFVFSDGLLSHWQIWIAATACTQYICWRLTRYSKLASRETIEADEEEPVVEKAAARV